MTKRIVTAARAVVPIAASLLLVVALYWLYSQKQPGAPPAYWWLSGPVEDQVGGIRFLVEPRGWYAGHYVAFLFVAILPEEHRGAEILPETIIAKTADGQGYEVGDIISLGSVEGIAVGAFTLLVPKVGKGALTLTVAALRWEDPGTEREYTISRPWVVSPLKWDGLQPNPKARLAYNPGTQVSQDRAHLALYYRSLTGCPEKFATSPSDTLPGVTPPALSMPGPTPTPVPLRPEYSIGPDSEGRMLLSVSVCSPEPKYLAARVVGPSGRLEPVFLTRSVPILGSQLLQMLRPEARA